MKNTHLHVLWDYIISTFFLSLCIYPDYKVVLERAHALIWVCLSMVFWSLFIISFRWYISSLNRSSLVMTFVVRFSYSSTHTSNMCCCVSTSFLHTPHIRLLCPFKKSSVTLIILVLAWKTMLTWFLVSLFMYCGIFPGFRSGCHSRFIFTILFNWSHKGLKYMLIFNWLIYISLVKFCSPLFNIILYALYNMAVHCHCYYLSLSNSLILSKFCKFLDPIKIKYFKTVSLLLTHDTTSYSIKFYSTH